MRQRKFSSSLNRHSTLHTTVAAANHNNHNQVTAVPPCPLSIRLIAVLNGARLLETCLSDHCRCCCATLVPPPPLVCCPHCFANSLSRRLHLLSRYCVPLVQLIVVLPDGFPRHLSRRLRLSSRLPIHWLLCRAASRCLVPWPPPPPFIMPPPLVAPLSFGWWSRHVAWCPGLSLRPAHWPLITQPPLVAPLCPPADTMFLLNPPL
jgi:hypothetical protein